MNIEFETTLKIGNEKFIKGMIYNFYFKNGSTSIKLDGRLISIDEDKQRIIVDFSERFYSSTKEIETFDIINISKRNK